MERSYPVLLTAILSLSLGILQSDKSFAKDKEIKPEEVVAKHLESIGKPDALAAVKSRMVMGTASVEYIQGVYETPINGQFQIASEGRRLGIAMKFNTLKYTGEYFAFDGHDVKERQPKLKYSFPG